MTGLSEAKFFWYVHAPSDMVSDVEVAPKVNCMWDHNVRAQVSAAEVARASSCLGREGGLRIEGSDYLSSSSSCTWDVTCPSATYCANALASLHGPQVLGGSGHTAEECGSSMSKTGRAHSVLQLNVDIYVQAVMPADVQ
jgi:hypothetical protein